MSQCLKFREKGFLSGSPFLKSFTSLPWDSWSPFKSSEARAYPKRSFIRAGRNGFSCLLYLPKARKAASLFNSCPVQSILVRVSSRDKPTGGDFLLNKPGGHWPGNHERLTSPKPDVKRTNEKLWMVGERSQANSNIWYPICEIQRHLKCESFLVEDVSIMSRM